MDICNCNQALNLQRAVEDLTGDLDTARECIDELEKIVVVLKNNSVEDLEAIISFRKAAEFQKETIAEYHKGNKRISKAYKILKKALINNIPPSEALMEAYMILSSKEND